MAKRKVIHVNQHNIRANSKPDGVNLPVITVKSGNENVYGHSVNLYDADDKLVASVVYQPNNPLPCGAKVWIVTRLSTEVHDRNTDNVEVLD